MGGSQTANHDSNGIHQLTKHSSSYVDMAIGLGQAASFRGFVRFWFFVRRRQHLGCNQGCLTQGEIINIGAELGVLPVFNKFPRGEGAG